MNERQSGPMFRIAWLVLFLPSSLFALHAGRDLFLPVAGRVTGPGGVDYYTSLWVTNVSPQTAHIRIEFLRGGETNPSPTPYAEVTELRAGETRFLDNVGEAVLKAPGAGAIRIQSDVDVVATARVYSWRPDQSMAASQGVSYGAIPARFAIGRDQSSMLQGVRHGNGFRYNLSLVETVGHPAALQVELRDQQGELLGTQDLVLRGHEQRSFSFAALFRAVEVDVALMELKVLSGAGRVLLVGSQIAEKSNDASAFEMQFPRPRQSAAVTVAQIAGACLVFVVGMGAGMLWLRWKRCSAAPAAPAEVADRLEVDPEVVGGGPQ